jgi:hypothetical protein
MLMELHCCFAAQNFTERLNAVSIKTLSDKSGYVYTVEDDLELSFSKSKIRLVYPLFYKRVRVVTAPSHSNRGCYHDDGGHGCVCATRRTTASRMKSQRRGMAPAISITASSTVRAVLAWSHSMLP